MSKNTTLAIAVAAALVVGGVAVAGYMNSRKPQAQEAVASAPAGSLPQAGANGEPLPAGNAIPASAAPRLDYADVLDVKPVTAREPLYASVVRSEPIRETNTVNTPREVCEDVVVQERLPERDGNVGGTVAGALIGGIVGNQIGKGDGRKLATVAGAVAGGYAGREIDKRHEGGKVVNRTERQCHTVTGTSTSERTVGWNVTYRKPDGSTSQMRMDSKPGTRIALGDGSKIVGYDVTYRYNGEQHTVRMDSKPGAQLPVIDGRVVTQTAAADGATIR